MVKRLISPPALGGFGTIILTIAIFFAQGGFTNMNPWYVVGLVIGIVLIVYSLLKITGTKPLATQHTNKRLRAENYISDLLWKMHRRLMKLAEKRAKEELNAEKFQIANQLIVDSTGVIKLEEQDKVMSEIKEKLGVSRLPKSNKGKKKLAKKLLHLSKEYQFKDQDKKWGLVDLIKIGENLDGQQMGVGNLRDRDNWKWKRWYKKVNSEKDNYNDDELDKLVNDNIFLSYGCCSEWLHTVYILKMSNEFTELTLSRLRGATANILINIDKAMEEKTRPIINRIKMEIEFFVKPGTDKEWFNYWLEERFNWYVKLGIKKENLKLRQHMKRELAHYALDCYDIDDYNYYHFNRNFFAWSRRWSHRLVSF
ncbi:hypothetical protein ES703_51475 [subsurface metagenome]